MLNFQYSKLSAKILNFQHSIMWAKILDFQYSTLWAKILNFQYSKLWEKILNFQYLQLWAQIRKAHQRDQFIGNSVKILKFETSMQAQNFENFKQLADFYKTLYYQLLVIAEYEFMLNRAYFKTTHAMYWPKFEKLN